MYIYGDKIFVGITRDFSTLRDKTMKPWCYLSK